MNPWLEIAVFVCALLLLLPIAFLVLEVAAALFPVRASAESRSQCLRCVILVPAHDEEAGIVATLASITGQMQPQDRLLVVADNCGDRTAELARGPARR